MKDHNYYAQEFKDVYNKQTGLKWNDDNYLQVKGDPSYPISGFNPIIVVGTVSDRFPEGTKFRGYTMRVISGGYELLESSQWFEDNDGKIISHN